MQCKSLKVITVNLIINWINNVITLLKSQITTVEISVQRVDLCTQNLVNVIPLKNSRYKSLFILFSAIFIIKQSNFNFLKFRILWKLYNTFTVLTLTNTVILKKKNYLLHKKYKISYYFLAIFMSSVNVITLEFIILWGF